MLSRIKISGFRSLEDVDIELAPLTVLYGPTASGKSSLLYALIVFKNFLTDPGRKVNSFMDLGFMHLGEFGDCVSRRMNAIGIKVSTKTKTYGITLQETSARLLVETPLGKISGEVEIPYFLNRNFQAKVEQEKEKYIVNWNGIFATAFVDKPIPVSDARSQTIGITFSILPEYIRTKVDIVPHRRGFFKPIYTPTKVSSIPVSEDEVATLIINEPTLAPKISIDLEKILNKDFRVYTPPGTATAFFISTDKSSKTPVNLVNDGFGVNQLVYLLAKLHRPEIGTLLIEEPEVHLHPTVIRSLVRTLCSIIREEGKQIILTTHSEVFVTSLLAAVRRKEIAPTDAKCYLVRKEKHESVFEEQKINSNGQIEGGLASFVEGELEDLKEFFGKK
ncbi:MAG: AAA family ATPase [Thermoplasmata archaeon]